MPRLPPSANTHINQEGLIYGDDFNDSYFSRDDGLEESKTVFLQGCGLPQAWIDKAGQDPFCFVIGELGFGTGLNVLATWALWNKTRPKNAILHIVTVEGFLLDAEPARAAHQNWPELGHLSDQLIAKWPTRAYGAQRVWFGDDGVCITFLIGPCEEALGRMDFQADCWFLDGFSPSRNPDMWSAGVFAQVARLSKPDARLATYSVAGVVRRGLGQAGFEVKRVPGFGSKRERLEGQLTGQPISTKSRPKTAIILGGGIAGTSVCDALTRRGIRVDLFDADPCGRTKASGNPVALIMPRLDRADTREARFFRAAYLMALSQYERMAGDSFAPTGVHEIGSTQLTTARLVNLSDDPPLPQSVMTGTQGGTINHLRGGLAYPDRVLANLGAQATHHPISIKRLAQSESGWHAYDENDMCVAHADMCVIAGGPASEAFCSLGHNLRGRAGQLSWAPVEGELPNIPISGGAYAAPFHQQVIFGATFEHCAIDAPAPGVDHARHTQNRDALAIIAPDLAARLSLDSASGRASVRASTNDQLPMVGEIDGQGSRKYVLCGLGSRGFTTAFLCAEMIASHVCGEPSPVEVEVEATLAPDRFLKRAAKRS